MCAWMAVETRAAGWVVGQRLCLSRHVLPVMTLEKGDRPTLGALPPGPWRKTCGSTLFTITLEEQQ